MADEFIVQYPSGSTLYIAAERISDGSSYTIELTDNTDDTYTGSMDTSAPRGQYICRVYKQLGASQDTSVDTLLHPGETRVWSGSKFSFEDTVDAITSSYRSGMFWSDRP